MTDVSVDRLVSTYIKIRDKRAEILREYESQDAELKEQLDLVTSELLELCKATGVESMRTSVGTVSRSVTTRYWTSDWGSLYAVIKENDVPQLLEQRIHQGNMKQFLAEHPESMPAGLNQDSKYTIRVTRARS